MQIIGTRSTSSFRVPSDYFYLKRDRFAPGVDPTTGGPCALVDDNTDNVVSGYHIDQDSGRVLPNN